MNITEHLEHIKNVEAFRARVAEQYGGRCARLIDVAFIGHMDRDQQTRFIRDVTQRGLLED